MSRSPRLRLAGVTDGDRRAVSSGVCDAVVQVGGFVLDTHRLSNQVPHRGFEIPRSRTPELARLLARSKERLDDESRSALASRHEGEESGAETRGTLSIWFARNEPDIKVTTPAVPG